MRRTLGSLHKARLAAVNKRAQDRHGRRRRRAFEPAGRLTLGELFKEWIAHRAAHDTGERYAKDSIRTWDKHIEPRLGRVKLGAIETDPAIIVGFDVALQQAGLAIFALLRAVRRWGRRRCPRVLMTNVAGLCKVPSYKRRRLFRGADPIANRTDHRRRS